MMSAQSSEPSGKTVGWDCLSIDRELFEKELETFVPSRIFDSHAHLYENSNSDDTSNQLLLCGPPSVGWSEYQERMCRMLPDRSLTGLFFGFPAAGVDFVAANHFVSHEVQLDPYARALMLVHPRMDPEWIREVVREKGFVGLKCYHVWSAEHPTNESTIPGYLPEEHVRIAHEEGLVIVLHIVRARALADSSNQEIIRSYATKYPDAQFILAHAARGFNPYHTVEGVGALRGLPNIWFDTSAITESGAIEGAVRVFGAERLLYGSDFPVSHQRGRCVAIGDSFLWLSANNVDFKASGRHVHPTLVGIESLRVLKLACLNLSLSDVQIEAIFYSNAAKLLKLPN